MTQLEQVNNVQIFFSAVEMTLTQNTDKRGSSLFGVAGDTQEGTHGDGTQKPTAFPPKLHSLGQATQLSVT